MVVLKDVSSVFKRIISFVMAILLVSLVLSGCGSEDDNTPLADEPITDLQLALLNSILYNDSLTELEGKSIEGHDELINDNYKNNIYGGNTLINQLKGFTLVDYDYGDITGFKAAAFTKGNSLVIVYGGTDHWTDFVDDVFSGLFDFSAQDGQAKAFGKDNAKKYNNYNLYATGYSLGGRLCYLGTEEIIDNNLKKNLKKVRTFNGLGVKEFIDFQDGNLSNIHSLQTKFADKTCNYIVEGDEVSDEYSHYGLKGTIGYMHIGTELKVPCTNEVDEGIMKRHDLYSIIDYLLNDVEPEPEEKPTTTTAPPEPSLNYEDFIIGLWGASDGTNVDFYEDGVFYFDWGYGIEEEGYFSVGKSTGPNSFEIDLQGTSLILLMQMINGAMDDSYHFEVLIQDDDHIYLVQVTSDETAETSPCKLPLERWA